MALLGVALREPLRLDPYLGGAGGDDGAVPASGLDQPGLFQFPVGASHRVRREAQFLGELPYGRQPAAGGQLTGAGQGGDPRPDLLVRWDPRVRVQFDEGDSPRVATGVPAPGRGRSLPSVDMAYEVASPRARPGRPLRRALFLLGVVLFVCCVGAAGLGAWNYQSIRLATGPAKRAAETFLADVSSGDHAGAYERLCPATREQWTLPRFALRAQTPSPIERFTVRDVKISSKDGQQRATVTVTLNRHSGAVDEHQVPVTRGDDGWRVCGDPF